MPSSANAAQVRGPEQLLRPDRKLLGRVLASGGEDLKKCMQCATCSSVCELTDASSPAPRKEMLWAQWGLKGRLMGDVDLWLCYQCNDCTRRCPRGARPGDVMAALRRECVAHYSAPQWMGRWASRPSSLLGVLVASTAVLLAASAAWPSSGTDALGASAVATRVVFPFWSSLPHGLLVTLFSAVVLFDLAALGIGVTRFWKDMKSTSWARAEPGPHRTLAACLGSALRRALWHGDFGPCGTSRERGFAHALVVYGFLALCLADLWVITLRYNPLMSGLVYPLGIFDPWKIMMNLAGLALLGGSGLMLWHRWTRPAEAGAGTYSDWVLLALLLLVALTGFASEILHYLRIEPLRYFAYATHLALALTLLLLLPYSKLAHVVYRTVAIVYAERTGRGASRRANAGVSP